MELPETRTGKTVICISLCKVYEIDTSTWFPGTYEAKVDTGVTTAMVFGS